MNTIRIPQPGIDDSAIKVSEKEERCGDTDGGVRPALYLALLRQKHTLYLNETPRDMTSDYPLHEFQVVGSPGKGFSAYQKGGFRFFCLQEPR